MTTDPWGLARGMASAPAYSGRDLGLRSLMFAVAGLAVAIGGQLVAGLVVLVMGLFGFAFGLWCQLQAERNGSRAIGVPHRSHSAVRNANSLWAALRQPAFFTASISR